MKNVFTVVNSWDFCLFFVGVIHIPLFASLQNFIASCDAGIFAKVCFVGTYIAISVIKKQKKNKY